MARLSLWITDQCVVGRFRRSQDVDPPGIGQAMCEAVSLPGKEFVGGPSIMLSLLSRIVMAVVASLTMTVFITVMVGWGFQQAGQTVPQRVLYWILFPTTFLLSTTVLEYLEDGNIARSLKVSLFYTGVAAALVVVLYTVAAVALPRPRHVRYQQRPLGWERSAFAHGPSIFVDGRRTGGRICRPQQLKLSFGFQGASANA